LSPRKATPKGIAAIAAIAAAAVARDADLFDRAGRNVLAAELLAALNLAVTTAVRAVVLGRVGQPRH